jgi:hypothetical protein
MSRESLTPVECRLIAQDHNASAKGAGLSLRRKSILTNIARSYSGLASQMEILDADLAEDSRRVKTS